MFIQALFKGLNILSLLIYYCYYYYYYYYDHKTSITLTNNRWRFYPAQQRRNCEIDYIDSVAFDCVRRRHCVSKTSTRRRSIHRPTNWRRVLAVLVSLLRTPSFIDPSPRPRDRTLRPNGRLLFLSRARKRFVGRAVIVAVTGQWSQQGDVRSVDGRRRTDGGRTY